MIALIDITGQRFNRWTVLYRVTDANHRPSWLCRCDCGVERVVNGGSLRSGTSKSCGCWNIEVTKKRLTTHGLTKHPLYGLWKNIHTRCYNKNRKSYKDYGGRGIVVCDRWLNSFENFYQDMLPSWQEGLTLDRVNNDWNYEPDNCRWITKQDQSKNRRPAITWTLKSTPIATNTSGIRGVIFEVGRNKWRASICVNGKRKNLGRFNTKQQAAEVYQKAFLERKLSASAIDRGSIYSKIDNK